MKQLPQGYKRDVTTFPDYFQDIRKQISVYYNIIYYSGPQITNVE